MPTLAEADRTAVDDVVTQGDETPLRIGRITAPFGVGPELMRRAIRHLVFEWREHRKVGLNVSAIQPIQIALPELSRCNELDQLSGEDDVDVGREHEPAARPANADVLRNHLEERQHVRIPQPIVELWRDVYEPVRAARRVG